MMKQYRLTLFIFILGCLSLIQVQAKNFAHSPRSIDTAFKYLSCCQVGNYYLTEGVKFSLQSFGFRVRVASSQKFSEPSKGAHSLNTANLVIARPCQLTKASGTAHGAVERLINWLSGQKEGQHVNKSVQDSHAVGLDKLKNLFSEGFREVFSEFYLWQYALVAIAIVLFRMIYGILVFVSERIIYRITKHWAPSYSKKVKKPVSAAVALALLIAFIPTLKLPGAVEASMLILLRGSAAFSIALVCYRSIDSLLITYFKRQIVEKETEVNTRLLPLLRTALKVVVITLGTLYTLQSLNLNVSALLAGASIGGVAFALASQDTIKNLFGSLMIFFDKPFKVGDAIVTGAIKGEVEEIGMRSSRIRTGKGSVISVPNAKLAGETIDNYGQGEYQHFHTRLAVAYDTPVNLIEKFLEGLKKIVASHPHTRKDKYFIYLGDIQSSKVEILFYIYFNVQSHDKELQCRHEALLEVVKLAEEIGIKLV